MSRHTVDKSLYPFGFLAEKLVVNNEDGTLSYPMRRPCEFWHWICKCGKRTRVRPTKACSCGSIFQPQACCNGRGWQVRELHIEHLLAFGGAALNRRIYEWLGELPLNKPQLETDVRYSLAEYLLSSLEEANAKAN